MGSNPNKNYETSNNSVKTQGLGISTATGNSEAGEITPVGLCISFCAGRCSSNCSSKCESNCGTNCGSKCATQCQTQCSQACESKCQHLCSGGADNLQKITSVEEIVL